MANTILLNKKIHDWTDVEIKFLVPTLGSPDLEKGITSINWKASQAKELQYAGGAAPHGLGYGHKASSCDFSLTLHAAELFESLAMAAGKDATDYAPFNISVMYMDKQANEQGILEQVASLKTVTLVDVAITDMEESLDEGTQKIVRKYTCACGAIVKT